MRSFVFFLDMFGGEYINCINKRSPQNKMDLFIEKLGGTIYKNCYTPAPDTGRSSACMWTGQYPSKNRCNHRLKYPRYFMDSNSDNLWKRLKDAGYTRNIFLRHDVFEEGLIPLYGGEHIVSDSIFDFFELCRMDGENVFNFLYIPDIHQILNEMGYTRETFEEGADFTAGFLEIVDSKYHLKELADYILLFSDHGFKNANMECTEILSRERIHTYVQLWIKGEEALTFDNKLRSNLDLFPTICSLESWDVPTEISGKMLSNQNGHDYLLAEDHSTFDVTFGQRIEKWAVILRDGDIHYLDIDGSWKHEVPMSAETEIVFQKIIEQDMADYKEISNIYRFGSIYMANIAKRGYGIIYSNGEKQYIQTFACTDTKKISGKKIVLYGAGKVGRAYYCGLAKNKVCDIVLWVDKNYESIVETPVSVVSVDEINSCEYDFIVVAIFDKDKANDIKKELSDMGIPYAKVIWNKPKIVRVPQ